MATFIRWISQRSFKYIWLLFWSKLYQNIQVWKGLKVFLSQNYPTRKKWEHSPTPVYYNMRPLFNCLVLHFVSYNCKWKIYWKLKDCGSGSTNPLPRSTQIVLDTLSEDRGSIFILILVRNVSKFSYLFFLALSTSNIMLACITFPFVSVMTSKKFPRIH